jgi:allantoinase
LLVHAELDVGAAVTTASPRSYQHFLESRPPTWEVAAIELMIELCRETGCAVHIVHLSAADALPAIEAAKAEGLPLSVETCAHYLCLHAEGVPDGDTRYKCAPPIRGRDNQERLWNGLRTGAIDFVVTDHSPCTPALKRLDDGDFDRAWGGIASLQLGLPSIWTAARARRFDVAVLTRWLCSGPARFAGLGHRKGELRRGYEADITVWDDRAEFEVSSELLEFRHKVSPYVGRRLCGRVVDTWVRGHRVYHRGQIEGRPIGRPVLHREENLP